MYGKSASSSQSDMQSPSSFILPPNSYSLPKPQRSSINCTMSVLSSLPTCSATHSGSSPSISLSCLLSYSGYALVFIASVSCITLFPFYYNSLSLHMQPSVSPLAECTDVLFFVRSSTEPNLSTLINSMQLLARSTAFFLLVWYVE